MPASSPPGPARPPSRAGCFAVTAAAVVAVTAGVAGYLAWRKTGQQRDAVARAETQPPAEAILSLKSLFDKHPDDPDVVRGLVGAMIRAGSPVAEVEPVVAAWCRLAPDDPAAFRTRMDVFRRVTRYPEAAAAGERVLALTPDDDATRAAVAGLYLTVGRYDDAAREFRALLASANFPRADLLTGLARAEWERGNGVEAARLTDESLAAAPDHPAALTLRGLIHFRAGDYPAAVAALRRGRSNQASEPEIVLYHLGLALDRLGRAEESKKAFADLLLAQDAARFATDAEQRPADVVLQARAAEGWLAADRPDAARRIAEAAVARSGPTRELLTALARAYDRLGRPDLAESARASAGRLP